MADALATLSSMFKVSPHRDFPYIEINVVLSLNIVV